MFLPKFFALLLFIITSIISQEIIESIKINGFKIFLSPQFIATTKLPILTTEWPKQYWHEKSDSALDSHWLHFANGVG